MEIAFMEKSVSLNDGNTVAVIGLKYLIKSECLTGGNGIFLLAYFWLGGPWQFYNPALAWNHDHIEWCAGIAK